MAKVERFEDLICWQEASVLVKEIYLLTEEGKLAKDFDTRSQIRRATLSVIKYLVNRTKK
ncbi:MAG: four helix bundle protein [Cyclobacteriaceae bacterium]|nr:four helix bundle protein [Cyclobacteriaceae bacterium]